MCQIENHHMESLGNLKYEEDSKLNKCGTRAIHVDVFWKQGLASVRRAASRCTPPRERCERDHEKTEVYDCEDGRGE